MSRERILGTALALIRGERAADYGDWKQNAQDIATGWSVILGTDVPPRKVALMMDWLKTVRLKNGPHADSWIDKAGYIALGGEIDVVEDEDDGA